MSKQDTKQHLLDIGTDLLIRDGFFHTGINEVLVHADVPKGSFYYYFKSKEDFGLQVLVNFANNNRAFLQNHLDDLHLRPLARLRAYFSASIERLTAQHFTQGCLIGNMTQEMADQSETFRTALQDMMNDWAGQIAGALREAQVSGEISPEAEVDDLANFCLNSWQGAILRMKVAKTSEPLEAFVRLFFEVILH